MTEVTPVSAIFLAIFFFSLVGFYIIIRRNLMKMSVAGSLAAIINTTSLIIFGIIHEDIADTFAFFGGIVVGLGFTSAMLTMAAFFRNNEPKTLAAYDAMLVNQRQSNDQ